MNAVRDSLSLDFYGWIFDNLGTNKPVPGNSLILIKDIQHFLTFESKTKKSYLFLEHGIQNFPHLLLIKESKEKNQHNASILQTNIMSILFTDIEAFVDNELHIKCVEANVMG